MSSYQGSPAPATDIYLLLPILPGQVEAWRRFVQELQGPQQRAWHGWRRRIGISTIAVPLADDAAASHCMAAGHNTR